VVLGRAEPARGGEPDGPLSPREEQVAGLIAEGLTNKAIAETLIVSPRTVDGHVERIFAKLDVSARAQVATWVAGRADRRGTDGWSMG
jgi:DNA-binding NarL/FixJ family response regulator